MSFVSVSESLIILLVELLLFFYFKFVSYFLVSWCGTNFFIEEVRNCYLI